MKSLNALEAILRDRNAERKRALLDTLTAAPPRKRDVDRFRHALHFIAAYPEDEDLFRRATAALDALPPLSFSHPFDSPIARWLGDRAEIDWETFENDDRLLALLPSLTRACEEPGLDDPDVTVREWIDAARGNGPGLEWLLGRLETLSAHRLRDHLYDALEMPIAGAPVLPIRIDVEPFLHPDQLLRVAMETQPRVVRLSANAVIELARATLTVREREMYPISHANPADVIAYDCGRGLVVNLIGILPERRMPLEGLWGFLLLKNGIPLGYGCFSVLFETAEIAFNIFESFRGGEAAFTYKSLMRVAELHAGAKSFSAMKYQFGHDNPEAIESGAFWFYYKLGFRHRHEKTAMLAEAEAKKIAAKKKYRTPAKILRALAKENLYLGDADEARYSNVAVAMTRMIAREHEGNRERAVIDCRRIAAMRLDRSLPSTHAADEFALMLALFDDLAKWSSDEKRELLQIIDAKNDVSEQDFVLRMNAHNRLKETILKAVK